MSDMREDVTRAVANAVSNVPGNSYDTLGPKGKAFYGKAGDAAIAAATPHIRRQVIEDLANEAEHWEEHDWERPLDTNDFYGVARWLRAHLETKP